MPILATVFEAAFALDRLEGFTSCLGAEFYGLPLNAGTLSLVKESWVVPRQIGSVVPFLAGKRLPWQVAF
jgi:dihydroorotase